MYIRRVEINNIKSFDKLVWDLGSIESPGWHVVLGDNGSGKSTFIKALSLLFVGPADAARTNADFTTWVKQAATTGNIKTKLVPDGKKDQWSGKGNTSPNALSIELKVTSEGKVSKGKASYSDRTIWGTGKGWFSSSFGPFRRFTGGDPSFAKLFYSYPKVARHLSAFNEAVALTETLDWLKELRFKELELGTFEQECGATSFLEDVLQFLNQDNFLPNGAQIKEVTSKGVAFTDGNGAEISIEDASDGHRSILSLMLELIRQMTIVYETENIFSKDKTQVICPGVVLIDEIDAHLHPRWQRTIGNWLCKHFPNVQFIVTTHSALVCQNAEKGSVFRLPRPGHDDEGGMITGKNLNRLIYGNILEAYGSGAFGEGIERSDKGQELVEEYAELNIKLRRGKLNSQEKKRHMELQAFFPTEGGAE